MRCVTFAQGQDETLTDDGLMSGPGGRTDIAMFTLNVRS